MENLQDTFEYAKEQLDIGNFGRVEKAATELRQSTTEQYIQYGILLDALLLSEQEQDEEAMVFYDELIQKYPNLEYAYYYRFEALIRELEFKKARLDALRLVQLDDKNVEYINCLIIVDEFLGDYMQVIEHCNKILANDPEEYDFIFSRAMAKVKLGHLKEALADYQYFIQVEDIDMEDLKMAYLDMGLIHVQLEEYDRAKSFLEKARLEDYFDTKIESTLGLIHAKTIDQTEGLAMINKTIAYDSETSYPFINRAKLLIEMGELERAKLDLNLAEQFDIDFLYHTNIKSLRRKL